jgi:hypothetical protein
MRKSWLVLGIVAMFIGILIASFGNASHQVATMVGEPKQSELHASSIGDSYSKGQKLVLGISPGNDWYLYADTSDEFKVGGDYVYLVSITVIVIDPNGNVTILEAEYRVIEGTTDLALFVVKVYQKGAGLTFSTFNNTWNVGNNNYTGEYLDEQLSGQSIIGGLVNFDGYYNVSIGQAWPPSPPTRLTLYKYKLETVKDQWFLIPAGAVTVIAGGILSIWATRFTQKKHVKLKTPPRRRQ